MAPGRIELPLSRCKRPVLPLDYEALKLKKRNVFKSTDKRICMVIKAEKFNDEIEKSKKDSNDSDEELEEFLGELFN